jgi:hypothetical protein
MRRGFSPPDERDWYVYVGPDKRCVVHEGKISGGGYEYKYGPETKDNCEYWAGKNCSSVV